MISGLEYPYNFAGPFIGPFEHVQRFRNLKFTLRRTTNIQSTVLSFSEAKDVIYCALKPSVINNQLPYFTEMGWQSFTLKQTAIGGDIPGRFRLITNHFFELTSLKAFY